MDAYLTRSQKVPVSLCLQLNPWNLEEVVEYLPAVRLRRLDVEFNTLPEDLGPLMLLRALNLECLTISSSEFVAIVGWPQYVQRPRLLSGEVTGLKALALQARVMASYQSLSRAHPSPSLHRAHPYARAACIRHPTSSRKHSAAGVCSHCGDDIQYSCRAARTSRHSHHAPPPPVARLCLQGSRTCRDAVDLSRASRLLLGSLPGPRNRPVNRRLPGSAPGGVAPLAHTTHLEIASSPEHLVHSHLNDP